MNEEKRYILCGVIKENYDLSLDIDELCEVDTFGEIYDYARNNLHIFKRENYEYTFIWHTDRKMKEIFYRNKEEV